jgi:phage terminase large subunit-like protein
MGLRGPGARPRKATGGRAPKLRAVLPWKVPGLSRLDRVLAFIEDMPITQGPLAGTKMKVRPWQRDFLAAVYREDADGNRPVRTAVLSMGRKNGKTCLASALALCHLAGPEAEPRGEIYSLANDRDQAARIFAEIAAILRLHPELGPLCNLIRFNKVIEVLSGPAEGSIFRALSAEATTKMGLSPSFAIYDELGSAPKRDLYEAIDSALGARQNPLLMAISTQAASDHAIMSELIDYGLRVNDGEIEDPSFHLTLHCAPEGADPWSAEAWAAANPALGDFRSLEDVERQAAQAQLVPSKESAFRNLILNQRVAAEEKFIARAEWEACGEAPAVVPKQRCFAGLDLSGGRDLTALVLVFPTADGSFDVLCRFFLPANGIGERDDREPWQLWARQGHLTLIPGNTIDPTAVAEEIARLVGTYDVTAIGFDRWRIEDLRRELTAIGCEVPLEPYGQGFKDMAPAVDLLERVVADRKLRHGIHPVLRASASHAVVVRDAAGNRKLAKDRSTGRIDGLVALTIALGTSARFEAEPVLDVTAMIA